jgi:hypothetical protein
MGVEKWECVYHYSYKKWILFSRPSARQPIKKRKEKWKTKKGDFQLSNAIE